MKRLFVSLLTIGSLSGILSSCNSSNSIADLVVYCNIYTAENENNGLAEAFAVKNGKYIFVGDKQDAASFVKEGKTIVIDNTNQGLIIPGCTEGHGHYFGGVGLNSQLPGTGKTYEDVLALLEKQYKENKITQFISFGWSTLSLMELKDNGHNFAREIEAKAPGIPVVLLDDSAHSAVCNITALNKAGINKDNNIIRGGNVYLDKDGEISGYIDDQAVFYVMDKAIGRPFSEQQYRSSCEYGMNELLKCGYTNSLDAFTNMYDPTGLFEALQKMDKENKLKINVAECFNMKSFDASSYQNVVDQIVQINKKYSSTHCDASYIKLFADGVVESGTGWISGEYKNPIDGKIHGNIIWEPSELDSIVTYANKKGLTIHTHAYGDAACKASIDSYIKSNISNNGEFRNCLAHVRNINEEDIIRAAENKIPISENLIWHFDYNENNEEEKYFKQLILDNIGEDYYYSGYPMKSLIDKGVIMSSSTDAPAAMFMEGNILNVIEVATTGMDPFNNGQAFAIDELITVKDALKSLTINGAWQLGLDKERGSIKVGKYADFVILDTNILNYEGEQLHTIHNAKILNTYFEGECVYTKNN